MLPIKLESDFKDYYDHLLNGPSPVIIYPRNISGGKTRGEQFELLHQMGVPTIALGAVRSIVTPGRVVVYTDTRAHHGEGKVLLSLGQAKLIHPNALCSVYYEDTDYWTFKIVQVGLRRYQFNLKGKLPLQEGEVVSVQRLPDSSEYPYLSPIYSIDYICTAGISGPVVLATDLNLVQPLDYLGFENLMTPEEVVTEVDNTFKRYGWMK